MSYEKIDTIILKWVERHNFVLYTKHYGCEVRSVDIVSMYGKKFQIWIDIPKYDKVRVHLWDYKKWKKDWTVVINELDNCLEKATDMAFEGTQ